MSQMFQNYGYKSTFEGLDLSSFNTSKVSNLDDMLDGIKLKTIKISQSFILNLGSIGLTNSSGSKSEV